jgi:transglutaminase-like putative cysteine protease
MKFRRWIAGGAFVATLAYGPAAFCDAPQWMHDAANAPLPTHDEKTDAVLLYSETNVTVVSQDRVKTVVREAYKILRPQGREHGTVWVYLNSRRKINSLHGWCIPAQGKDYEVKDKEAVETSPPMIAGAELVDDVKFKVIHIPAPDPGNIIGYEYETEERPFVLQDIWDFQGTDPVRESRYSLQLPAGWEYKASWLNYPEARPTQAGNILQWVVRNQKAVKREEDMPPLRGLMGMMVVSFLPPGGPALNGYANWRQMGSWYLNLTNDRILASPDIKQKVGALTASAPLPIVKMKALAEFTQRDIRYVAIELGIGGWQPHPAAEVFTHRYGDCKDKATLMRSMLNEIGVASYYVIINTRRGAVTPETPAHNGFNHAIIAISLPDGISDNSLLAVVQHPKLGRLLFFDPTDEMTPFGQIRGQLQSNYGLVVMPDGGELVELPKQAPSTNRIDRVAYLTLDASGKLHGEVKETRVGDRARSQRWALLSVTKDTDRIKPIETLLAGSMTNFHITKAVVENLNHTDQPFGFDYTFEAESYAQTAGNLLLVRPRVLGSKTRSTLETKEARQFPVEFDGPVQDTDKFEITMPPGFTVDELPPPMDIDVGFASYHSKTEANGNVIGYTRTFEVKELSVPVSKTADLKKFYRAIATDERSTAVLKPAH